MIPDWLQDLKITQANARVPGVHWIVPPSTMARLMRVAEAADVICKIPFTEITVRHKEWQELRAAVHGEET